MAGYKTGFEGTPAAKKNKKKRKKGFFERLGERWGDAAADYLLDDGGPAVKGGKKKK